MLKKYLKNSKREKDNTSFHNLKSDNNHKLFHNLKSQAALEFLTTYAWAFLVILIMIGALAYFGILQPTKLLPDRCNFGAEINCVDYTIGYGTDGTDGTVNLRLKNSVGEPIVVDTITISTESTTAFACIDPTPPASWSTGALENLAWTGCNTAAVGFVSGEKGKISITMTYHLAKSSTTYTRQVAGEVFATVI
tara:strand:- start:2598 stop:3179 length:582 start_codon:yes stop_codon:yes gene_type:complete